nr:MAG TPA: STT3/PglB C-terminal beta-barrel domain [Crassvirales sp.]
MCCSSIYKHIRYGMNFCTAIHFSGPWLIVFLREYPTFIILKV